MELLDRFDEGETDGYWQAIQFLYVRPDSDHIHHVTDPDVSAQPRWATLETTEQERVVQASAAYLVASRCSPENRFTRPSTFHLPNEAAYRALILMLRYAPQGIKELSPDVWKEWAPVLATQSTETINGAKWEDKERILEWACSAVEEIRTALLLGAAASAENGTELWLRNETRYLWDGRVASEYIRLAQSANEPPLNELVELLAELDFELTRPLLLNWLETEPAGSMRRIKALDALFQRDLAQSWARLRPSLEEDLDQTAGVIVRSRYVINGIPAELDEAILADVYLWTCGAFPPEGDPQFEGVHSVGPREEVGRWRDQLVAELRDRGTINSVSEIQRIVNQRPEATGLRRTLAIAAAALRSAQWQPTSPSQLVRLAENQDRILVHDESDLSDAVVQALAAVQNRLTGANPESHLLWDTHSKRPKSEEELSDYIARQLRDFLRKRGIVVNREVQVRRSQPSGIGERTDIQIDAVSTSVATGQLRCVSLPIEVKGAWNTDLVSSPQAQLADRYMRDLGVSAGVYVVLWPDLDSWADGADGRKQSKWLQDRTAAEMRLTEIADHTATLGAHIKVVNLDMSYRRVPS